MKKWGTSASIDPFQHNLNLSAEDFFNRTTRPISFENEPILETLSVDADRTNSPTATVTSPAPIIEPFMSPISDQVDVTIAYLDHLPGEVSVAVDTQLLNDIEVAAALLEHSQDADHSDDSKSTPNASELSEDDFPVDIDLMLALRRWNVHVHNSRDAMAHLL